MRSPRSFAPRCCKWAGGNAAAAFDSKIRQSDISRNGSGSDPRGETRGPRSYSGPIPSKLFSFRNRRGRGGGTGSRRNSTYDYPKNIVLRPSPLRFGLLDRAKKLLLEILVALEDEIAAGTPIVVLEPSCASVFRDELLNLFPNDERRAAIVAPGISSQRISQQKAPHFHPPQLPRKAIVHGHCHHKSIMKMTARKPCSRKWEWTTKCPPRDVAAWPAHSALSKKNMMSRSRSANCELLPAVRNAPPDSLIIADGFSCREQIEQCTGRKTIHLAEVIQLALKNVTSLVEFPKTTSKSVILSEAKDRRLARLPAGPVGIERKHEIPPLLYAPPLPRKPPTRIAPYKEERGCEAARRSTRRPPA